MGTPPAEVEIDGELVACLLEEQVPWLAGETVEVIGHGWDNVTARVGLDHAARLPRRALAVPLIEHEQRWLGELSTRLDVPIPVPVHAGVPTDAYPWPWSIVPWIEGTPGDQAPPAASEAARLARLLTSLHTEAPAEAPPNPFRGVPLRDRDASLRSRLSEITERRPELAELCTRSRAVWERGLAAPPHRRNVWLHGDLHAGNVLTTEGSITGLIDWGDVTSGDAANDLASLWALFDPADHGPFWRIYAASEPGLIERAAASAVAFGAMLLATGLEDDPGFLRSGLLTLERVTAH